jgi:hypothetical protein
MDDFRRSDCVGAAAAAGAGDPAPRVYIRLGSLATVFFCDVAKVAIFHGKI